MVYGNGGDTSTVPQGPETRYEFLGEVARGGMGIILQTRDQQLRRDIACKVLRPELAGTVEVVQRFVEEAQIAGQLQHPCIVPIYEMGRLSDQRPYFTMRLVKGSTLAAQLRERHSPSEDLSRFLGIFEQICQAMAYAHARGVIHRDLKPSNVMVGRFGEVQVMDWGLAKVLGERPQDMPQPQAAKPPDASFIRPPSTRDSSSGDAVAAETSAGSVLGTVAYMAPEQARGDTELLDQRTDVFGLGAVLCEILTGKPPYTGDDSRHLFHRAACGDLRDALERLDQSGADEELVALVKRCLAVLPADRPENGGAVAAAVRAHLDGIQERLRRAQLDQAAAEARADEAKATAAAERRAKRLTGGLAASLLLLGILGVATWRWRDQIRLTREAELAAHRSEVQQRDQRAMIVLQESITLMGEGKWSMALASARRAADLLDDESDHDLRDRIARQTRDLQLLDSLERARIDSLGVDVKESRISHEGLTDRFTLAFREAGLDLEALDPQKMAAIVEQSGIRDRLVAALWFWLNTEPSSGSRDKLRALLQVVDRTSPARRAADARDSEDQMALRKLVADTDYTQVPADMVWVVAGILSQRDRTLAREWLLHAQRVHPSDFWVNFNLGHHMLREGAHAEAIGYFRVALAAHPRHAGVMLNLALSHLKQQAFPEAELFYREAIRAEPEYAVAHTGLGNALRFQNRHEEAAVAYREAIKLCGDRRDNHWENARVGLGESLRALNDPTAADWLREVVDHNARHFDAWLALARMHYDAKSWSDSERCYREGLKISSKNAPAQSGLAATLLAQQRYADAETAFRVARELLGTDRGPDWTYATKGLADAIQAQGRQAEATEVLAELESPSKLADRESLLELASSYRKESRWVDAERCYRQVLALDPKNIQTHTDLGTVLSLQQRPQESAEEFQIAFDLLGSDRGALWEAAMLGYATNASSHGNLDKAVKRLEEILKQNPRAMAALYQLGTAYRRQRNWTAAESAFRRAVELIPKSANPHVDLGSTLLGQERYPEAEAEFRVALDLLGGQRTIGWQYSVVGRAVAVAAQGNPEQALEELRRRVTEAPGERERHRMIIGYHAFRREWSEVGRANMSAWQEATDDFASVYSMRAAAAFLLGNDVAGYREVCSRMLDRHRETSNPVDADRTVKACCLSRHFDGDLAQVQRLAELAVRGQENHSWYVYFALARGMAALRTGDWNQALEWTRKSREQAPTFVQTAAPDSLIESLAHHRLGHAEESRQALTAAIAMREASAYEAENPFDANWGEWLIFDALQADIESLLAE